MGLNDLTLFLLTDSHECEHRQHEKQLEAIERLAKAVKVLTNLVGVGILATLHLLSWVVGSVARNDHVATFAAVVLLLTVFIAVIWTLSIVVDWAEREIRKVIQERRRRKQHERERKTFLAFIQSVRDGLSCVKDEDETKKEPTAEAAGIAPTSGPAAGTASPSV